MGRKILAIVSGLLTGIIVILLIRTMSLARYPFPEGLDWLDSVHRNQYIATLPDAAFWMTIISQMLSAFLAGLITALIAIKDRFGTGLISVFFLFAFVLIANFTHEYPTWFMMMSVLCTAIGGFVGAAIGNRRVV